MKPISPEEFPNRAFQLAYFLHCERKIATEIASQALNKLQLAATAQGKRLYYRLTGRLTGTEARKLRSKVSMEEPHLLQRLVYAESEGYERRKEAAALAAQPPDGAIAARKTDLVVYFIKHLVRITTKRNSFYVTLGLSRLLYNYTTAETMEIYNLIIQDPDRVHDDYYYRSRKGVLLKELKERFGALIEVAKGARGEQRWRPAEDAAGYSDLVRECLLWFTPWATPCVVPERFDPLSDTIDPLNFQGRQPDEEHEVEVNRIHATLHPDCFARLAAANRLAAPEERLELPHFFLADDNSESNGSSRTPPTISEDELRTINELLAHEATRRKAVSAGFFRVLVDGCERAIIDLQRSITTQFDVDESAEIIEIYGQDQQGPLLMATHLLGVGPATQTAAITLENGQQISFVTNQLGAESDGSSVTRVTIKYEERSRPYLSSISRAWTALGVTAREVAQTPAAWWKPAAAFATFALLLVGIWWIWSGARRVEPEVVRVTPTPAPGITALPSPNASPAAGGPAPEEQKQPRNNPVASPSTALPANQPAPRRIETDETYVARAIVPDANSNSIPDVEPSRGWDRTVMGKPLREVKLLYVQAINDDGASDGLPALLRTRLSAGGGLQYAGSDAADAALKISVRPASQRAGEKRVIAIVRVVNANGYVVWPDSRRGSSWRYIGRPNYVADRVLADLSRGITQAQGSK